MVTENIAKRSFAAARKIYEGGGNKSGNKKYDDPAALPWYTKLGEYLFDTVSKRNARAAKANATLNLTRNSSQYTGTRIQKGQILCAAGCPAANCDELTNIAAYLATQEGALGTELFAASLTNPADHVFCVYGTFSYVSQLVDIKIRDLELIDGLTGKVFAIDPWANTVCSLNEYPKKVSAKMKKWLKDGKRVYWPYAPNGAGTYPPSGVDGYDTTFLAAPMQLSYANQ